MTLLNVMVNYCTVHWSLHAIHTCTSKIAVPREYMVFSVYPRVHSSFRFVKTTIYLYGIG